MSGGLSVIPPGFSAASLKPQPAWLRFRLRSSYASGSPSAPSDFMSLPSGGAVPTAAISLTNFTWVTNVSSLFRAAYARASMIWTYNAVSTHKLVAVLSPWSGPAPLQVPASAGLLIPSLSELRFVGTLGWSGGSGLGGADIFSGFMLSDWNGFAIGSAVNPWPDIAGNSYIGLIINRSSGLTTVCVKKVGAVSRVVIATLSSLPANVAYTVDHRFTQATMTRPAFYSLRVNGITVAKFSFTGADSPVYSVNNEGIAPALFGSFWDTGGSTREEHVFSLDFLAGPGAHAFPLD